MLRLGTVHTEKSTKKATRTADDNAARAAQLARELRDVCDEYLVEGIVGELPSGGAQSARAATQMAMAAGVVASFAVLMELPVEWATPTEVKKAITGKRSATKEEIMGTVCKMLGGTIEEKPHGKGRRLLYHIPGHDPLGPKDFEHAADSVGAYLARKDDVLVRAFG